MRALLLFLVFGWLGAARAETFILEDGSRLDGEVRAVTRGIVVFYLTEEKREEAVEIRRLSEESRRQVAFALGLLTASAAQAAVPTQTAGRAADVIDVTQPDSIAARYGQKASVIGRVKEVVTLGSAGHKRVNFEGSDFYIFISQRYLKPSAEAWKLESLTGKVLQVTGEVVKYQEAYQMAPQEPSQLVILPP